METLEKVKTEAKELLIANEKESSFLSGNSDLKVISLNGNDLFELQQAVQKTLSTSVSIKGEYVRFFLDNLQLFDPVVIPLVELHSKVIQEFASKNEDGSPMRDETGFVFENEELKSKYNDASEKIWGKVVNVYVKTISTNKYDQIEFNMKENNTVYLIIKWLTKN